MIPRELPYKTWRQKLKSLGYLTVETERLYVRFCRYYTAACDRQTDRQTDGRTHRPELRRTMSYTAGQNLVKNNVKRFRSSSYV